MTETHIPRPSTYSVGDCPTSNTGTSIASTKQQGYHPWFNDNTPSWQQMSDFRGVQSDWSATLKRVTEAKEQEEEEEETLRIDRSYVNKACAASAQVPDFTLGEEDFRALMAISTHIPRTIGIDYSEEWE